MNHILLLYFSPQTHFSWSWSQWALPNLTATPMPSTSLGISKRILSFQIPGTCSIFLAMWCIFWSPVQVGYSQFQDQHHLRSHLVDLVEVDDPGAGCGQLKHGNLMDDLHPAVLAFPSLPHELCSILVTRAFLHTLSDHSKLPPGRQEQHEHRIHNGHVWVRMELWMPTVQTSTLMQSYLNKTSCFYFNRRAEDKPMLSPLDEPKFWITETLTWWLLLDEKLRNHRTDHNSDVNM